MHELAGQAALVTGGASGLGLATARRLVASGAHVVLVDLGSSNGAAVAHELGGRACFSPADVTDDATFCQALDAAEQLGPLRAVVHCAGVGGDRLRILNASGRPSSLESFEEVLRTNLIGTYNVLRLAAARMAANEPRDHERGAVVLTASIAAFDGQIGQTSYAASKAAIHGMTLVAARDLAAWGIRVNTIAPGVFETPMTSRFPEAIRQGLAADVPFPQRLGSPDDYADLAACLLSNPYVNGETVRLDGALRMAPQ